MRILVIDGGGIRGIVPAVVLAEIERRAGKPISELFDLIAGTSTGGILACALARSDPADPSRPRYRAEELVPLYVEEGPKIFDRSLVRRVQTADGLLDERYDDTGLRTALERYLDDTMLSDARTDILVTAYELEQRFAFLFRSSRAKSDPTYDFSMADVAHATSAAPTYFEPVTVRDRAGSQSYALIDGGVFAANPAMVALADIVHANHAPGIDVLVSLGTGEHTRPISARAARGWGQLQWATHIVDVVFDGVAETVDFEASQILAERYVRLQAPLVEASDALDDASAKNLAALRRTGEQLVRDHAAELDRVVELLGTISG